MHEICETLVHSDSNMTAAFTRQLAKKPKNGYHVLRTLNNARFQHETVSSCGVFKRLHPS